MSGNISIISPINITPRYNDMNNERAHYCIGYIVAVSSLDNKTIVKRCSIVYLNIIFRLIADTELFK